ncbi:MAG TPA: riboflavin synthase [Chloroflexota bacterium]
MFTGIVEEVGTVRSLDIESPQDGLTIRARRVLSDAKLGDSIAVNGTCLTVTRLTDDQFTVGVMPETLRRTNLGSLHAGDVVNLERPLQPESRLGGHFVQGHIDGTGVVAAVTQDGSALAVRVTTSPDILKYVVEKGFIAIDGVSLTVTSVDDSGFGIGLISYTQENIAEGLKIVGQEVNLEVDVLAKYVEKLVIH